MFEAKSILFSIDVATLFIMLLGILWSVASPSTRVWPPPGKNSWQYFSTWVFFFVVFALNAGLLILDWNTWLFSSPLRFILGIPLVLVGATLFLWGFRTLGMRNTSGLTGGFILDGPYRFTRNPQYLGDIVLLIGLSVIANSALVWITHALLILIFLITPIPEEDWLKEQYRAEYRDYFESIPRFL